jgi:sugar phosphate isomerase/epimerase
MAMSTFTLSAFADEISPSPDVQLDILEKAGVRFVELRSVHGTNVLSLTDDQVDSFHRMLVARRIGISAIGSPIGKIPLDQDFGPHLKKFKRAIDLCGVLGTDAIRVFSFYPPESGSTDWESNRGEVLRRMEALIALAEKSGIRLFHENEHRIYGDSPERVADLLAQFPGRTFSAAYDAANFVFCGYCPWEGWLSSRDRVAHLHIKDWKSGAPHGALAGQGDGRWLEVLKDAVVRGYQGFATLEPHLLGGGPTGGVTGPELFPKAVDCARNLIVEAGGLVN